MRVKKVKIKYPLAEKFLYILENDITSRRFGDISIIYFQLFSMLSLEALNIVLNDYKLIQEGKDSHFKEHGKTEWFGAFHKMLRQADLFEDCYRNERVEMSDDERQEYRFLLNKVKEKNYDKSDKEKKSIFNSEYRRYLELSSIKRRETTPVSINGRLDSILWNIIHIDKQNYLMKSLLETFDND
jgi:dsDNA-binding SOS-regulon protein